MKTRRAGLISLILGLLAAGTAAVAPQASASEGTPPTGCVRPAYDRSVPVAPLYKCDVSGSDQDAVWGEHPNAQFDPDYFGPDGEEIKAGYTSTGDVAEYVVTTKYWNSDGEYVDGPTYTYAFDLTVSGEEAADRYSIEISDRCFRNDFGRPYRVVAGIYENVPDLTKRRQYSVYVQTDRDGGGAVWGTVPVFDIADGESVRMPIAIGFDDLETPGLYPGGHEFRFYQSDTTSAGSWDGPGVDLMQTQHTVVPKCARFDEPRGTLVQVRGKQAMRVSMSNDADRRASYRLLVDPRRGASAIETFRVPPATTKTVTYANPRKARLGTRYKLQAQVERGTRLVWDTLATKTSR